MDTNGIRIRRIKGLCEENNKIARLRSMLEVAVEQGVALYKSEKPATVQDIVEAQRVCEDYNYVPEFIVKNSSGEIKEIWYGDTPKK